MSTKSTARRQSKVVPCTLLDEEQERLLNKKKKEWVTTPAGRVRGFIYDSGEIAELVSALQLTLSLNEIYKRLGGRASPIPEVISEAIYAHYFNAIRTPGVKGDLVDIATGQIIELKASISTAKPADCSSFSPKSVWDRLIFMDFAHGGYGPVDGKVELYRVDNAGVDINKIALNKAGGTFKSQQGQTRRPRFSIREKIIATAGLKPFKTLTLW